MVLGLKRGKSAPAEAKQDWPGINELVWVRLPCCDSAIHPSRAEDIGGATLAIAAPARPHLNPVPEPEEGKTFIVGWREGVASKQVRVQWVESRVEPVPTWVVRAVSVTELIQRRRFVRANWDCEIEVILSGIEGATVGTILDVSEGGLRCRIPTTTEPRNPYFPVKFDLDGVPLMFDVEVAWWGTAREGSVEIGLQFVSDDRALSDRLRSHAFALQLEERKKSRE